MNRLAMDKLGSELPELIGGKYRPVRLLGRGGMSTVYVVEHIRTGEQLALKVITFESTYGHEAIERFKREARASARIRSDHVVRVIDADVAPELGGAPYLVMDLLEGQNLEDAAGQSPQLPGTVVHWLRQVARALDKAHALGIIHRDLKPENLFLWRRDDDSTMIKILDFGIAKMTAESTGTTQSGQLLGTPLYMSPEQARGDGTVTAASDLYALGLIAYRLLTGEAYWTASTVTGLIAQIIYEPMEPPSKRFAWLGPAFDAWFARACHRDPSKRFESAMSLVEHLAVALRISLAAVSSEDAPIAASGAGAPSDETPVLGLGAVTLAGGSEEPPAGDSGVATARAGTPRGAYLPRAVVRAEPSPPEPGATPDLLTLNRAASTLTPPPVAGRKPLRKRQLYALAGGAALLGLVVVWRGREPRASEPTPSPLAASAPAAPGAELAATAAGSSTAAPPDREARAPLAPASATLAASQEPAPSALPPTPSTPPRAGGIRKPNPSNVTPEHRTASPSPHGTMPASTGAAHKPAPYDPLSDQK